MGIGTGLALPACLLVALSPAPPPRAALARGSPARALLPPGEGTRESPLGRLEEALVLKGEEIGPGGRPRTKPERLLRRAMARLERSRGTLYQDLRASARAFPWIERAFPGDPSLLAAGEEALEALRQEVHGEQQWLLGRTQRVTSYGERVQLEWGAARISELIVRSEAAEGMAESARLLEEACRVVERSRRGITLLPPRIDPPPFRGTAPDFLLVDKNPSSATRGAAVSPRKNAGAIVAVFFMAST